MNKNLLAVVLAAIVAISLSACGQSAEEKAQAAKQEQQKKGLDAVFGGVTSKSLKEPSKEKP